MHLFSNLWFVRILLKAYYQLIKRTVSLCSFFPKLIQLIKVTHSISKIYNSTQLSKFVTKFYYKLFCFFLFGTASYFNQYSRFTESIYVDVCIV